MIALAWLSVAAWLYLLVLHGRFWRSGPVLPAARPGTFPPVAIVVPARDEAAVIGAALASLLAQDYAGPLRIILVDDCSTDGTAAIAARPAVTVVQGRPRPPGWAGKLWAVAQGVDAAGIEAAGAEPEYLLLTDADIVHAPGHVAALVAHAQAGRLDLVSEMVELACDSPAERALVPAFVYFFQLLYPFAWVADPGRSTAAAAGGTVLLRADALARVGGIAGIRGALIDDVALAMRVKAARGRIWLGHSALARSIRPYPQARDLWRMIARSAYVQLRRSPPLLVLAMLGMGAVWLVPPLAVILGPADVRLPGALAWAAMALSYVPSLRRYRLPLWRAPLLPLAALFYMAATIGSAFDHWRGRGVVWKGRAYADTVRQ